MLRFHHMDRADSVRIFALPWVYFHGGLEDQVASDIAYYSRGFQRLAPDLVAVENGGPLPGLDRGECAYADGVYVVEHEGTEHPVKAFFWVPDEDRAYMKGLICFANDEDAIKYARSRMLQRAPVI